MNPCPSNGIFCFEIPIVCRPNQFVIAARQAATKLFDLPFIYYFDELALYTAKDSKMKTLSASVFAIMVLLAGAAHAQVGAGAQVGPVGAGAGTGPSGTSAGAHVGGLGVHVGLSNPFYHRVCHGGWYWHHHRHICRRW